MDKDKKISELEEQLRKLTQQLSDLKQNEESSSPREHQQYSQEPLQQQQQHHHQQQLQQQQQSGMQQGPATGGQPPHHAQQQGPPIWDPQNRPDQQQQLQQQQHHHHHHHHHHHQQQQQQQQQSGLQQGPATGGQPPHHAQQQGPPIWDPQNRPDQQQQLQQQHQQQQQQQQSGLQQGPATGGQHSHHAQQQGPPIWDPQNRPDQQQQLQQQHQQQQQQLQQQQQSGLQQGPATGGQHSHHTQQQGPPHYSQQMQQVPMPGGQPNYPQQSHHYHQQGVPAQLPAGKPAPSHDWEYTISRVWLPRVFIVVLLLGVMWGFMAAVNAGYLSEPVRCLLGIVLAVAMYWFGNKQVQQQREALGQVLLGGANAILVLTFFAAHMLYDILPIGIAFVLYIMSIIFGIFTAVQHRSQTLVIIAMLSGFLIPFLIKSPDNPWMFILYEALFSIAMMLISVRFDFRGAYIVAFAVLHVPLLLLYAQGDYDKSKYLVLIAVIVQHLVLYTITVTHRYRHKLDQMILLPIGFILLSFWIIGLYGIDDSPAYSILITLLAVLYSITALTSFKRKGMADLFASIATYSWVLFLIENVTADFRASVLLIIGLLSFLFGIKLRSVLQQSVGLTLYLYSTLLIMFHWIDQIFSAETLAWILLLVSFPIPYFVVKRQQEPKWVLSLWKVFNWGEALFGLLFLTQITNILTESLNIEIRHLTLSSVWIVYSVVIIIFGIIANKSSVRLTGVVFLFLLLLKVIVLDLPWVTVAVRAILFIALGLAGIITSRLLYRKKQDVEEETIPPVN